MENYQIILSPVLSEKATISREGETKKYVFRVNLAANKFQVMSAVKALFSVEPVSCTVLNVVGKKKAVRARSGHKRGMGSKSSWKKAYVTLKKGDRIEQFEGV